MITIYHNPRCSKSREAFHLVECFAQQEGVPVEVIEYLKTPPSADQLASLQRLLGCSLREMIRTNEDAYEQLGLAQASEAELLNAIVANPVLLQRPIVVYEGRALIARPPELLNEFLQKG